MKPAVKFILAAALFCFLIFFCFLLPSLYTAEKLKEALYYTKLSDNAVQCRLCPRNCVIPPGKRGFCRIRENQKGRLFTLSYGKTVAVHLDPIEKKPLFHFLPGTTAFSVATAGCNLKCKFCQNWEISQKCPEEVDYRFIEPQDLIERARASTSPTIAYTYTEPVIFFEYMLDCAKLTRQAGLRNIMHSNGYVNEAPLRELAKYLDAANIDLKGFSEEYYARLSDATLAPVLNTLKVLKEEGVHLEITNLVLPGFNDFPEEIQKMCLWIKENLGADTPLHFSRFFPTYKLLALNPTPVEALERARQIALDSGLKYVYIGNVGGNPAENTYCPQCGNIVIRRAGYMVLGINLTDGRCDFCKEEIRGVWE